MQKAVKTITVNDVDFIVEYGYTEYRPATRYEAPELPEIELTAIMLDGHDVHEMLNQWVVDEICKKIECPTKQDEIDDWCDMKFEQMRERHFFKD